MSHERHLVSSAIAKLPCMSLSELIRRIPEIQRQRLKQVAAIIPPWMRQSRTHRYWRRFLHEAQYWPVAQIRSWQLERLRRLVHHAISKTEGYRELYSKAGLRSAEDIRALEDLRHLPFTSKELFRDNLAQFSVASTEGRYITTGGSTGIPFGFRELYATSSIEDAFMRTGWSWTGWHLGLPSAVLRGGYVGDEASIARYDPFTRELALSSYFLMSQSLPRYVRAIRDRNIRVMQAYPSSMNLLCDLVREHQLEGQLALEIVFLGSENVYPWQLEKFRSTFPKAKFFSWYGHCEKAVLAPWCEHGAEFHAWPFYGITEVIQPSGGVAELGEEGEIVGTSFHQMLTPFIRYRTLDHAVRGPEGCTACGRAFPILTRITGRAHEVIVTHDGRFISMTAINMHDDIFDGIRQFQFLQEKAGALTFNYVPKANSLTPADEQKIRAGLLVKFGKDMVLALNPVREIPRTKAGKFRFLDQRMTIQYGDKA